MVDTVLQHSVVAPLVIRPFFYGHLADFYDIAIPLLQLYLGPVMRPADSIHDSWIIYIATKGLICKVHRKIGIKCFL